MQDSDHQRLVSAPGVEAASADIELHTLHTEPLHDNPTTLEQALQQLRSAKEELRSLKQHGHHSHGSSNSDVADHNLQAEYFDKPIWHILGKRMPWLVGLLILQSFSAAILHAAEDMLKRHIVIAVFIPCVVGTGGNAGNQPGVMVTRALAVGTVNIRQLLKREALLGLMQSLVLAVVMFVRVVAEYPTAASSALAIAVSLSLSVFVAMFLAILFSFGLDRLRKCDPADGSAPLLTTIADLVGISLLCLVSYLVLEL